MRAELTSTAVAAAVAAACTWYLEECVRQSRCVVTVGVTTHVPSADDRTVDHKNYGCYAVKQ